jgi:signal peptidase I
MGVFFEVFNFLDVKRKHNTADEYCARKYPNKGEEVVFRGSTKIFGPSSCQGKKSGKIYETIPYKEVQTRTGAHNLLLPDVKGGRKIKTKKTNKHKKKTNKHKKKYNKSKSKK